MRERNGMKQATVRPQHQREGNVYSKLKGCAAARMRSTELLVGFSDKRFLLDCFGQNHGFKINTEKRGV